MFFGHPQKKQNGLKLKILSALRRVFLNRTPMGVSLQMPSIVIDGPAIGVPEGEIALQKNDSSSCDEKQLDASVTAVNEGLSYDEPIRTLTAWLEERGWTVKWYTSGDHVDDASLPDRLVTVSKRQVPRHRSGPRRPPNWPPRDQDRRT